MKPVRKYSGGGSVPDSSLAQRNRVRADFNTKKDELEKAIETAKGTPEVGALIREYKAHMEAMPSFLKEDGGTLSENQRARRNYRFQRKAEKDNAMVAGRSDDVEELKKRLEEYEGLKERGQIKRGVASMAGLAAIGELIAKKSQRDQGLRGRL
jgi:hypothetical protein